MERVMSPEDYKKMMDVWFSDKLRPRAMAFDALHGEREYQEQFNPNVLSVGEELCLIQCYVNKAMAEYANTLNAPSEPATRDVIRKIGAMCLRCMENHGSIKREVRDE